jgi:hypothetical protein
MVKCLKLEYIKLAGGLQALAKRIGGNLDSMPN